MAKKERLKKLYQNLNNIMPIQDTKLKYFAEFFSDKQLKDYRYIRKNETRITEEEWNKYFHKYFHKPDKTKSYLFSPVIQMISESYFANANLKNNIVEYITTETEYIASPKNISIYTMDILFPILKQKDITPENINRLISYFDNDSTNFTEKRLATFIREQEKSIIPEHLEVITKYYIDSPKEAKLMFCSPVLESCLLFLKSETFAENVLKENKEKYRDVLIQNKYISEEFKHKIYEEGINPQNINLKELPKDISREIYNSISDAYFDTKKILENKIEYDNLSEKDKTIIETAYNDAHNKLIHLIKSKQLSPSEEYDLFIKLKPSMSLFATCILYCLIDNTKNKNILIKAQTLSDPLMQAMAFTNAYMPYETFQDKLNEIASIPFDAPLSQFEIHFIYGIVPRCIMRIPNNIYKKFLKQEPNARNRFCIYAIAPDEILDDIINDKNYPSEESEKIQYATESVMARINKEINKKYPKDICCEFLSLFRDINFPSQTDYTALDFFVQMYEEDEVTKNIIDDIQIILNNVKSKIESSPEQDVANNFIALINIIQNRIKTVEGNTSTCLEEILKQMLDNNINNINEFTPRQFYDNIDNTLINLRNISNKFKKLKKKQ